MKKYGLDASTAVILDRVDMLELFCSVFAIVTTPTILSEVGAGTGSEKIVSLLKRQHVITEIKSELKGENEILVLYLEGIVDCIVSDDGRFLRYCRKQLIPHHSSITVPYLLYKTNSLAYDNALLMVDRIIGTGRFSEKVIHIARSMLDGKL